MELVTSSLSMMTIAERLGFTCWRRSLKLLQSSKKDLVHNQSDRQIKVLRSNHGGEYDSKAFHDYCKQHGIRRHFTTRYTSQQNGVAERKNMTIMNMVRSMLKGRNLSNEYCGEEVSFVIYVINRSPTKSVISRVPKWAWSSMYCSVSHLRVFGCVAYAHVPNEWRGKLDDKSEKWI